MVKKYPDLIQSNLFQNYNFLNVANSNEEQIVKKKIKCELSDYIPVKIMYLKIKIF